MQQNKYPGTYIEECRLMNQDLNKLTTEELGNLFPIVLSEYNPEWRKLFLDEGILLSRELSHNVICNLHHIGSTSVPGLIAKPTIDILIIIKDETDIKLMSSSLKRIGYYSISRPENPPPHLMFAKGYSEKGYSGQPYHLHPRYAGDWDEIIFRDFLLKNPEEVNNYSELKKRLSVIYEHDREMYTTGKTDFITGIVKLARERLKNKS